MTSDEQLIERIRGAMVAEADRLVPSKQMLAHVIEDAAWARPRRRPTVSAIVPALAAIGAVAIAVVAVVSLSHRHPVVAAGAPPRPAQGLVAKLSVLRRPQLAADRLPGWAAARAIGFPGHGRLVPGLSRLVRTVRSRQFGEVRVYLVVETPPGYDRALGRPQAPLLSPRLGDQAATVAVSRGDATVISLGEPAALLTRAGSEQLGAGIAQGGPGDVRRGRGVAASIVPDGVAYVKWVFSSYQSRSGAGRPVTVYPVVGGNAAVAPLTIHTGVLARATWYDARGRVIASFDDAAEIAAELQARQAALERSGRRAVAPSLLRHFAVLRSRANLASTVTGGLPIGIAAGYAGTGGYGLNVAQTRFVPYPAAPHRLGVPAGFWVIPGGSGIAFMADGLNLGTMCRLDTLCSPLRGGFFIATAFGDGTQLLVGLVPDGNATVTVEMASGATRTARVIDNVYSVYLPRGSATVVDRNAAGRRVRFPLGVSGRAAG